MSTSEFKLHPVWSRIASPTGAHAGFHSDDLAGDEWLVFDRVMFLFLKQQGLALEGVPYRDKSCSCIQ